MSNETILIVDDDSVNLTLLRLLISRRYDYKLVEAIDGTSALALARSTPDLVLILLDVRMPDISGIEVCRQLKQEEATQNIPIVLISAVHTDAASIREGLDAGADGYITKPIEDNMLQSWIRAALRISELKQALDAKAAPVPEDIEELLQCFTRLSHDVNNSLQGVMACSDLLSMELEDNAGLQGTIEKLVENSENIAQMVGQASRQAKAFRSSHQPVEA
jgi:two-component system, sensor histidine kinase and response regulator